MTEESNVSAQATGVFAKIRSLADNRAITMTMFIVGIILTVLIGILVTLELFAYLAYCGFYGQYNTPLAKQTKKFVVPGEVFFTTAVVIIVGVFSLLATLFNTIVSFVNKGPSTGRNILLIVCLVTQFVAMAVLVMQSANFGGQARILQKTFENVCPVETVARDRKNCWGMVNSLWTIFAGCLLMLFSVIFNTAYSVFILMIKN